MAPILNHRSLYAFEHMSPDDVGALLATARSLRQAAGEGGSRQLLRGKNLGLLCAADHEGDAALFRLAAVELGAHVAHIRPSLSERSSAQEVRHTARMLGRLYDAVECQGMGPRLVRQVGCDADVPVYDGIACLRHPTARLSEQLGGDASPVDNRRFILQAVLLSTLI